MVSGWYQVTAGPIAWSSSPHQTRCLVVGGYDEFVSFSLDFLYFGFYVLHYFNMFNKHDYVAVLKCFWNKLNQSINQSKKPLKEYFLHIETGILRACCHYQTFAPILSLNASFCWQLLDNITNRKKVSQVYAQIKKTCVLQLCY